MSSPWTTVGSCAATEQAETSPPRPPSWRTWRGSASRCPSSSRRAGPTIDWRNAAEGPADLDVALTAVILAQVAVDEAHPSTSQAGAVLTAFLRCVGDGLLMELDCAGDMRRRDPALVPAERELLDAAVALVVRHLQPSPSPGA
jgi:hypothetical protein